MNILVLLQKKINSGSDRTVMVMKNVVDSLVIKGISILTQLLIVPITLNYVSSEIYGIWLTISSIIMWLSFFDVGLSLGLKNKLAEAIARNDLDRGKILVSTTYGMMIFIFIPLCVFLELLAPLIDWITLLNIDSKYYNDVLIAIRVIIACFCFQMIVHVLASVASAYQRVALASAIPVVGNVFSLITIYVLTLTCPPSLFVLALAISFVPILIYMIYSIYYYNRDFKLVSPVFTKFDFQCAKSIFGLGYKFFIIKLQLVVLYQTANFIISNISGPEEVTSYNISYKYFGVAMMVFSIITSPFWPAFTDAYTKQDFDWMNSIYTKLCKVYGLVFLTLCVMLTVSNIAYNLWVGDQVHIPLIMSVAIAVYMILQSWFALQIQLINGIGTIQLQTIVSVIGMIIHIPLSLFFGKYVGGIGVVFSMIIITLVYVVIFTTQIRRLLANKAKGIWAK